MPMVSAVNQSFVVGEGGRNDSALQSISASPNGNFLIAWTDYGRDPADSPPTVKARLYDPNGTVIGSDIFITTGGMYQRPDVTALSDNTFLVTWNDSYAHHAQKIGADGTKIGDSFPYSPTQETAAFANGQYVSVWASPNPGPNEPYDPRLANVIRAQVRTDDGTPVGSESTVTYLEQLGSDPEVATLTDGHFVVIWKDTVLLSDGWWQVVRAQLLNVDGTKIGNQFDASPVLGELGALSVASLTDGGFVVSWNGSRSLQAQLFRADGSERGSPLRIDSDASHDEAPSVIQLDNGRIAFAWTVDSSSVHIRVIESDGTWTGSELEVDTEGSIIDSSLTALPGGRFVLAWTNMSTQIAQAQIFSAELRAWTLTGTQGDDSLEGDRLGDSLYGAEGEDWLQGFGGNDTLDGGDGADTVEYSEKTGSVTVTLKDVGEASVLINGVAEDTVRNIENVIGGSGQNKLTGNASANVFVGDDAYDVLVTLGGNDTAFGEGDNDYLYMGAGDDVAVGGAGVDVLLLEAGSDNGYGGDSQDYIFGGEGNDYIFGEGGVDVLQGEGGDDYLDGGEGSDYFYGGIGNDIAYGGVDDVISQVVGNDIFVMGDGDDEAYGETGQDYFYMGNGDDYAAGGAGVDVFLGGAGDDFFDGGQGVDYAWGELGDDGYNISAFNNGVLVIQDFTPGGTADALYLAPDTFLKSMPQIMGAMTYYPGMNTTIFTIDGDTSVWLVGVNPSQLTISDFYLTG